MRYARAVVIGVALGLTGLLLDTPGGDSVPPEDSNINEETVDESVPTTKAVSVDDRVCSPAQEPIIELASEASIVQGLVEWLDCVDHVTLVDGSMVGALETALAVATHHKGSLLVFDPLDTSNAKAALDKVKPESVTLVGREIPDFDKFDPEIVEVSLVAPGIPDVVEGSGRLLLVSPEAGLSVKAVVAAAARVTGFAMVAPESLDPRGWDSEARSVVSTVDVVTPIGFDPDEDFDWQIEVAKRGLEVPGGGQLVFADRRVVALYGHPQIRALGVMGEQGPEEAAEMAREYADAYTEDGLAAIPAFEIIATIASAEPTNDNDYSMETSIDVIRPWVELAQQQGMHVILDLQPGRTDYLTQAKIYEELLKYPHVGLALDPEWRLEPDQLHLRQIGSVDAEEINQVVDWLSAMVRDEALPQKIFLLHQFNLGMITNRSEIRVPSELAVVIQMDGQGPLPTKFGTYRVIVRTGENPGWEWGWKNFIDEDTPMALPGQVLELDPLPVFISFQ